MKVYEATVIDKCANPDWEEPMSYESYVAVATLEELKEGSERASRFLPAPYTDEDIHFYFNRDDWGDEVETGDTIEREEFKYLIGRRVA